MHRLRPMQTMRTAATGPWSCAIAALLAGCATLEEMAPPVAVSAAVLDAVRNQAVDHQVRLDHYRQLMKRDYPDPSTLSGLALDQYLVLRGGILLEEGQLAWLTEYLEAHS